jgi:hypothetical protein
MNILRGIHLQSLFESLDQIRQHSGLDATQDGFDLRLGQLVRWIRWQIDQVSATRAGQLFQAGSLVSRKIIHKQNIALASQERGVHRLRRNIEGSTNEPMLSLTIPSGWQ